MEMIKKAKYILYRHAWMQIMAGRFLKPVHYAIAMAKYKFFGYPYLAVIETTNTCNLNCPTCPTPRHKLERAPQIMSLENFKKIIDNLADSIHIVLLYNTNEPLIHPDLPEMIRYCDKKNLYTMISTNAGLLSEEKSKALLDAGLDEILLCLDGTTKESYEPFRKGAEFETVYKNIEFFCEEKKRRNAIRPYTELQFILHKLNQSQIPEVKKLAEKWNVNRLRIKSFSLCEYAYTPDEMKALSEQFLPEKENLPEYGGKIIIEKTEGGLKLKKKRKLCALMRNQCSILADGNLVMCCYDIKGKYVFGNLLEKKFKDIWFNVDIKHKRKLAREKTYPLCKICGEY
jgi:MoaA/NifB/PqqE/SkfB family radical SAM enzyme